MCEISVTYLCSVIKISRVMIMHTVIQSGFGAWLIIGCVLFVILLACAGKVYHKMKYENHKHHFIVFNDKSVDSIYGYEDDDDE